MEGRGLGRRGGGGGRGGVSPGRQRGGLRGGRVEGDEVVDEGVQGQPGASESAFFLEGRGGGRFFF